MYVQKKDGSRVEIYSRDARDRKDVVIADDAL